MRRQSWLALLVCVNLVLLTGIVLASYSPPAALAQGVGLSGNYLAVAGEIQSDFDALYLLDVRNKRLHTFYYDKSTRQLAYAGNRDLERDFRRNKD
jgi:hypothetical protein